MGLPGAIPPPRCPQCRADPPWGPAGAEDLTPLPGEPSPSVAARELPPCDFAPNFLPRVPLTVLHVLGAVRPSRPSVPGAGGKAPGRPSREGQGLWRGVGRRVREFLHCGVESPSEGSCGFPPLRLGPLTTRGFVPLSPPLLPGAGGHLPPCRRPAWCPGCSAARVSQVLCS